MKKFIIKLKNGKPSLFRVLGGTKSFFIASSEYRTTLYVVAKKLGGEVVADLTA